MAPAPHKYSSVVLGFAEPVPQGGLHPNNFPSKAGGLPIWLYGAPHTPPPPPRCAICLQPQRFLAQLYAPVEASITGHSEAFHRVLYISVCGSASCQRDARCASVLRAQLPRRNEFYPYDGGGEGDVEEAKAVCVVCGFGAGLRCGGCRAVGYCGTVCQKRDWGFGHRRVCAGEGEEAEVVRRRREWRFREFEVVTECHPTPPGSDGESDEESDEEGESGEVKGKVEAEARTAEAERDDAASTRVEGAVVRGTFQDAGEDELPEDLFRGANRSGRDAMTRRFCRVAAYAPEQIVRYEWGGEPLWAGVDGRAGDAGCCERCGARRVFELQVMPQLAYFIAKRDGAKGGEVSIAEVAARLRDEDDWGTIVVFSCSRSCQLGTGEFAHETAWAQRLQTE